MRRPGSSSWISPSLPSDGGEGWGPLLGPLPARSSQGDDGELDAAVGACATAIQLSSAMHTEPTLPNLILVGSADLRVGVRLRIAAGTPNLSIAAIAVRFQSRRGQIAPWPQRRARD